MVLAPAPFLRCFAQPDAEAQLPADVAVVIPSILRPTLLHALTSVFAQDFRGRVQVLVGVDAPAGELAVVEAACARRPPNCSVWVLWPGYSTSARHGGLCLAHDGGALRCILTHLANSRHVAYLDDDNWWAPEHLRLLRVACEGRDWAFSLRWFVHPATDYPVCVDLWESVGPGQGAFAENWGGFVDPSCLMIDKLACPEVAQLWTIPLSGDASALTADRSVFNALRVRPVGATGKATAFYCVNPEDEMHPHRLQWMGEAWRRAENKSGSISL